MVATQFSLLNWNHLSLKQREILTSGMLAAGQNPPLPPKHVGAAPKHIHLQYYHGNPDISCPLIPRYGLPMCPVIKGEQILRAQVTISNTSRVVDQVYALNCTVLGSNPRLRPVHYQEVRSKPLK